MLHGDDAPTCVEVVDVARCCACQPSQQSAARPQRRKPTRHIGYARVTGSQTDLHRAVRALLDGGAHAADIHTDYGPSARTRHRQGLSRALAQAESGDTLIVPSLVTFARTQGELARLLTVLRRREISVQLGGQSLADLAAADLLAMSTAITHQLLNDLQAERAAIRAGQHGRGSASWILTPQQTVEVIEAFDDGQPRRQIAATYNISLATVFRIAG